MTNEIIDYPRGTAGRCDMTICPRNRDGFCFCVYDCATCDRDDVPVLRKVEGGHDND